MAAIAAERKGRAEAITAVYRVNLHCPRCASKIERPLFRTQGVQVVEVDIEKNEIKVKGVIDATKIHKQIEKWSNKRVELISPKIDVKKAAAVAEKKVTEVKQQVAYTTVVKMYMHCAKCEKDLQRKLLRHRGIHGVKIDTKAQTLTIQSTLESEKLLTYLKKKVRKHAEIVSSASERKEEKTKEVKIESKDTVEFKEVTKTEGVRKDGNVPYFVHYVYAPQLFSDENPNACNIM